MKMPATRSKWAAVLIGLLAVGAIIYYVAERNGGPGNYGGGYYHTSQGSEAYPYAWFKVLERPDSEVLFSENLERFGLVADPHSDANPLGLPIGITVAKHAQSPIEMIGMSCAACHTAQIAYQGQSLIIDGGTSLFDSTRFFDELYLATDQTLHDRNKRFRFLKRYLGNTSKLGALFQNFDHPDSMEDAGRLEELILDEIEEIFEEETENLDDYLDENPHTGPLEVVWSGRSGLPEESAIEDYTAEFLDHEILGVASSQGKFWDDLEEKTERHSFLARVYEKLATDVRLGLASLQYLENFSGANFGPETPPGPGRVDAFGKVRNLFLPLAYGKDVLRPATAPVSVPDLWDLGSTEWLHWNGNTNSTMQRNILEAIGSGAMVELKKFDSTIDFVGLDKLENMIREFEPPEWPAGMLGGLDAARVARGKNIFEGGTADYTGYRKGNCVECHGPEDNRSGGKVDNVQFALNEIGTDPNHAEHFNRQVSGHGDFYAVIEELTEEIENRYYTVHNISPETQREWKGGNEAVEWRSPIDAPLPARPLRGIWATAPYLHNGSVPTLHHLLLPASERPQRFPLGHREYDPEKVGYQTDAPDAPFTFDVNEMVTDGGGKEYPDLSNGNSNRGHEYGVDLSGGERLDLLEYLKSL